MKNIEEITIRPVTEADAEKLLSIYAPYVTDTFITYEYTVPTVEEFRERIRNTLQAHEKELCSVFDAIKDKEDDYREE